MAGAGLVINAMPGDVALDALTSPGNALAGKILLDVSNATTRQPDGMPGDLLHADGSLAERLQAALPRTLVVKALNTMVFSVMVAHLIRARGFRPFALTAACRAARAEAGVSCVTARPAPRSIRVRAVFRTPEHAMIDPKATDSERVQCVSEHYAHRHPPLAARDRPVARCSGWRSAMRSVRRWRACRTMRRR